MKNKILKIFFSTVITSFFSIFAAANGGANGGGGHGTYCSGNVKLLDYLQIKTQWTDLTLDMGKPGTNVDEALKIVLNRLEKVNPNRARLYQNKISEMRDKKNFHRLGNTHTNDSSGLLIPSNCHDDLTIAWQLKPQFAGDREFNFNLDLVEKIKDGRELAGLFLHEAIEWEFLSKSGDVDPTLVRRVAHFNAFISSVKMNGITLQDYIVEVLNSKLFTTFDVQYGIPASGIFDRIEFYSPNKLKRIESFNDYNESKMALPFGGLIIDAFSLPDGEFQHLLSPLSKGECGYDYGVPADFAEKDGLPCYFGLTKTKYSFEWGTLMLTSQLKGNKIVVGLSPGNNKVNVTQEYEDSNAVISVIDSNNNKVSCKRDEKWFKTSPVIQIDLATKEIKCVR